MSNKPETFFRDIWQAHHFEDTNDAIGISAKLTVEYCERVARIHEARAYTEPSRDDWHAEQASIWYLMATEAKNRPQHLVDYNDISKCREVALGGAAQSPFTPLKRDDMLPDRKDHLNHYYAPKIDPDKTPMPSAEIETPYGIADVTVYMYQDAIATYKFTLREPVTIYSVSYDVTYEATCIDGKTHVTNRSHREGQYGYDTGMTTAARKQADPKIKPLAEKFVRQHLHWREQAYHTEITNKIAQARATITERFEELRAALKYVDILEGELAEGHLNTQDVHRLHKLQWVRLERRG